MCDFKRVNVIRTRTHSDTGTDIETNTHAMYLFLEDEEGAGSEGESIVCSCDVIVYGCTWCDMRVDNNAAVSNKCGCEWHWV